MSSREKRTESIAIRVEPSLKAAIQSLADDQQRSISQKVHILIANGLGGLGAKVRDEERAKGRSAAH